MCKKGFTLVEVLISIVLLGVAICAILGANVSFTKANGAGTKLATAEFLTEQIRTITAMADVVDPQTGTGVWGAEEGSVSLYDDLDDFDGLTFSPPIDANANSLSALAGYSQRVIVENVSASNFGQTVGDHGSDFVRVTVIILSGGEEITRMSWVRAGF